MVTGEEKRNIKEWMHEREEKKNSHALVLKKEAGLKNSLKQIELGAKKCPRSRDIKSQNRTDKTPSHRRRWK
jgi:hypothetical protein